MGMGEERSGQLSWTVDRRPDDTVVTLEGDLDRASCEGFIAAMDELQPITTRVTFDASNLNYVDSTGLRLLLQINRQLEERGGELVLRRPARSLTRLLEITNLGRKFQIEE
jgi:anti-sigma B factor antagonist